MIGPFAVQSLVVMTADDCRFFGSFDSRMSVLIKSTKKRTI